MTEADGEDLKGVPPSKRVPFVNKASVANVVVRGDHAYASDIGDLKYLAQLGMPVGQIAVRMSRSPEAVLRMLAPVISAPQQYT